MRPFISLCYQFPWRTLCPSGAFRVSHCLIYKVQTAHRRNYFSLPDSPSFVKHFFKLFCRPTRHTSVCTLCCHSHNVLGKRSIRKTVAWTVILMCRHYLSSRAVASQVFSAQVSLTAVFGMGTGGPSLQSAPTIQFPKTWPPWTNQQGVCPWKRKSNEGNELSR